MSIESYVLQMRVPDVPQVEELCEMLKLPGGSPIPYQDTFDLVAGMVLRGEIPHVQMKEADFDSVWKPLFKEAVRCLIAEPHYHKPFEMQLDNLYYTVDIAKGIQRLVHHALRALKKGPVAQMTARVQNDTKAKAMMSSLYIISVIYISLRLQFDIELERMEALGV
jgi:hypothetical protein